MTHKCAAYSTESQPKQAGRPEDNFTVPLSKKIALLSPRRFSPFHLGWRRLILAKDMFSPKLKWSVGSIYFLAKNVSEGTESHQLSIHKTNTTSKRLCQYDIKHNPPPQSTGEYVSTTELQNKVSDKWMIATNGIKNSPWSLFRAPAIHLFGVDQNVIPNTEERLRRNLLHSTDVYEAPVFVWLLLVNHHLHHLLTFSQLAHRLITYGERGRIKLRHSQYSFRPYFCKYWLA